MIKKFQSSDVISYKLGKSVKESKVVALSVKGKEQVGKVIYQRKAEYKKPRFAE